MAQVAQVPFVVTPFLHLGDPNDPKDWIRKAYTAPHLLAILRQADRVIVQTPTELRAVEDLGIESTRIVLQGLGVDLAECTGGNRVATRQAWGIRADEVVVGHLANLSMEKGSPDVLAAVEMARQSGLPFRAVLAGPEMPNFSQFWKWSGPDDWITRLGPLTDQQRRDFYAGIDIFALPSRSDSFGLVVLEAWANGVPVIGYAASGVVDVIRHEQDGLLVKCADLDELARGIRRMAENVDERIAWGRAGQERLKRDFRWDDKLRFACEAITVWSRK
jgi:glycosyltransferase involved in cell wall biosynthesis